jgi:hypothetical protein
MANSQAGGSPSFPRGGGTRLKRSVISHHPLVIIPHIGPLIPPSFRTRQKWIMIRIAAASGIATQCST